MNEGDIATIKLPILRVGLSTVTLGTPGCNIAVFKEDVLKIERKAVAPGDRMQHRSTNQTVTVIAFEAGYAFVRCGDGSVNMVREDSLERE